MHSTHLKLSPITIEDQEDVIATLNNKIYSENTLNIPYPYGIEEAKTWYDIIDIGRKNGTYTVFVIREIETNQFVGCIGLSLDLHHNKAELGYWINQDHWNKGYATEATKLIVDYAKKELNCKRIFATCFDTNIGSAKVLEKAGFLFEGKLMCHTKKNNEYQNHLVYAIINH